MRPAEFTAEQIIEAGKALQEKGRSITGFALRQVVGGGNPARMKQVWDEHVASTTKPPAPQAQVLPEEINRAVEAAVQALGERLGAIATHIHSQALQAAHVRVEEVRRAAAVQRDAADRELTDAGQAVEDMKAKVDSMQAALDEHVATIEALRQELGVKGLENAQLTEHVTQLVAAQAASDKQHAAVIEHTADYQVEVNELRRKLAEAHKAGETQLGARAALEHQVADLKQRETVAVADARSARDETATLRGRIEGLEAAAKAAAQVKPAGKKAAAGQGATPAKAARKPRPTKGM